MTHPFGLGQDLQERLAEIATVSLVSQATGQWLLALAATREAILAASRRIEDAGHSAVAKQLQLEALLLSAECSIGPLDKAIQSLFPVVTALDTTKRDGRPQAPQGQDRPRRGAPAYPADCQVPRGGPFDGKVPAADAP